jgi:type I restriction enzyme R subunit
MTKITENSIEQSFIDQLVGQGYRYAHGTDIAPGSEGALREDFSEVVLRSVFETAVEKLNVGVGEAERSEAVGKVLALGIGDVMTNNELFHSYITNGVTVSKTVNGEERGVNVRIFDTENPENNDFLAVNQFVIRGESEKRLDVVLFINGLPLVVVELKNAVDEKATVEKAYKQIQTYKEQVPRLFDYNALCIISDGIDAGASSLSAPLSRYLTWKADEEVVGVQTQLQTMAEHMLNKDTLVKLVRYCTVFEREEAKDATTGIISQITVKKVAAYHQYYAVQKAIQQTLRATAADGDKKIGVVWHTQGSGKSLTMVFYTGQMVTHPQMENPTVVVLTDRNDLDDQLFGVFGNCVSLLRQKPARATSREHLKELLNVSGGGVVFTTIQKFAPAEGNVFDELSDRSNIIVMADEAHRSQYGFTGRVVETEEGSEIRYGNAKYIRDALPSASYIGFTGTPIEKDDRSTPAVFGEYVDVYDIKQAVDDGSTVPISYEARLAKVKLSDEVVSSIDQEIENIKDATEEQVEKAKQSNAGIQAIVGHPDRVADIANDIVTHFEARQESFKGKAMVVCLTREICIDMYNQIVAARPQWHSDDVTKGKIKIVMTSSSDDGPKFQEHATTKQDRKNLAIRLKDVHDELDIVIVRDMWLTGFDAPYLHTMYIDKKMQGANLMQAIARVNRVYKDKPGGLIVDYIGIGQDLRAAMATYMQSGGEGQPVVDIAESIAGMLEKFEIVEQMFHGFAYERYFEVEVAEKLQILLGAQNFILQSDELKNRFINQMGALSKLFAFSVPSEAADTIKDQIAFFQAVKARISKFNSGDGKTDAEVNMAVRQIVDEALSSGGVIDIFEAAGMSAPSVSILSDEFLLEVKNMKQKNVAFELLKKLLSDELHTRQTVNIAQSKKFSEMLMTVVKRYHNNQIDSAQVLEELTGIAKELRLEDENLEELGLTSEEFAFYTVLKENSSTTQLEDNKMKELIHVITETVRKNRTLDWDKMESKRAAMRLAVKKILMKYGYPPDVARMEADKVLEQCEGMAVNTVDKNLLHSAGETDSSKTEIVSEEQSVISPYTNAIKTVQVPLYDSIGCGDMMHADSTVHEFIEVDEKLIAKGNKFFVLRTAGDSMDKLGINEGDLVLCRKDYHPEDGNVVVALIGDDATLKKYHREHDAVVLRPCSSNPKHREQRFYEDDGLQVQGVMVQVLK